LIHADGLILPPVEYGQVVGKALLVEDDGQRFGIVAATTPDLPDISSPRNVEVTPDLPTTAAVVQTQIDRLYNQLGVRKIIFVSHLQSVANDLELIALLSRIDVAVAGGGDELLLNPDAPLTEDRQKLPGEAAPVAGTYPLPATDLDGRTVPFVTTAGNYKYLGRIDVEFDANGEVEQVLNESSYPRRVIPQSDAAAALGIADAVAKDPGIVQTVEQPVQACLSELGQTTVATTEVLLDVSRAGVRGQETNAGNLIADSFLAAYDRYAAKNGFEPRSNDNPVIAVQNGGGIRQNAGDILPTTGTVPGPITRLDTLNVLPFSNYVTVVSDITPDELKTIFERSAETIGGGQFLQVGGMRVAYNINNPVGSRVRELILADGRPIVQGGAVVAGAPNVAVVTNSFTAAGGDTYPTFENKTTKRNLIGANDALISYEEALVEYLTLDLDGLIDDADPRYQPGGEGRIRFVNFTNRLFLPIMPSSGR
jgi:5'-nucleotidase